MTHEPALGCCDDFCHHHGQHCPPAVGDPCPECSDGLIAEDGDGILECLTCEWAEGY